MIIMMMMMMILLMLTRLYVYIKKLSWTVNARSTAAGKRSHAAFTVNNHVSAAGEIYRRHHRIAARYLRYVALESRMSRR